MTDSYPDYTAPVYFYRHKVLHRTYMNEVLTKAKEIESILTKDFKAVGRGLHEKITSVASQFRAVELRGLRTVATVRNKLAHEEDFKDSDIPEDYFQLCDELISILKAKKSSGNTRTAEALEQELKEEYKLLISGMIDNEDIGYSAWHEALDDADHTDDVDLTDDADLTIGPTTDEANPRLIHVRFFPINGLYMSYVSYNLEELQVDPHKSIDIEDLHNSLYAKFRDDLLTISKVPTMVQYVPNKGIHIFITAFYCTPEVFALSFKHIATGLMYAVKEFEKHYFKE